MLLGYFTSWQLKGACGFTGADSIETEVTHHTKHGSETMRYENIRRGYTVEVTNNALENGGATVTYREVSNGTVIRCAANGLPSGLWKYRNQSYAGLQPFV